MIGVDTNILVYAHRNDSPFHGKARAIMRELVEGSHRWAMIWPCVHEFISTVTHPRIFKPVTPLEVALEQLEVWVASPSVVLITEAPGHWPILHSTLTDSKVIGPQVYDARIAAICEHHGVELFLTADRDFTRFNKLNSRNPLLS